MKIVLCRVPHNSAAGIRTSAYLLWAGYLHAAIKDLITDGKVDFAMVDGETMDFVVSNPILRHPFINKVACAFFPR